MVKNCPRIFLCRGSNKVKIVKTIKKSLNIWNTSNQYIVNLCGALRRSAYFINFLSQLEYFSNGKIAGFLFLF